MNVYVQIREVISQSTSDYDKEKAQERLAKLSGGVAVLKVSFKGKLFRVLWIFQYFPNALLGLPSNELLKYTG